MYKKEKKNICSQIILMYMEIKENHKFSGIWVNWFHQICKSHCKINKYKYTIDVLLLKMIH